MRWKRSEREPQGRCYFGMSRADITPPPGIYHRMWGAAKHERATGVHRPLFATVAVFGASEERGVEQVLVALDHCVMGAVELNALVEAVVEEAGLGCGSVNVVFSHTHAAGLMGLDRRELPGGELIPDYLARLGRECGRLAREAMERAVPAWVVQGTGRCSLARYRDYFDEVEGVPVVGYVPGVESDDTLVVARFSDANGRALATVVNYACHPTTLAWENTLISPDFVGAMREVVEEETGVPCLFLQGASGELGPRVGFVGDAAVADRNGRVLGYAALSVLLGLGPAGSQFAYVGPVVSGATLGSWEHRPLGAEEMGAVGRWRRERWSELLRYRADLGTVSEVEQERAELIARESGAREEGRLVEAGEFRALAERKTRMLHRLAQLPTGESFPLDVAFFEMGDLVWVVVQGESYSLLQRELRARFPERSIVVASIAGDWGASYLLPRELYGSGIYQETIAAVEAGSLERLIEAISARLKS